MKCNLLTGTITPLLDKKLIFMHVHTLNNKLTDNDKTKHTYNQQLVNCTKTTNKGTKLSRPTQGILVIIISSKHGISPFGHIVRTSDETDAKKILTASSLENWRRPSGRPRTTWMKTIQQDLKSNNLSLDKQLMRLRIVHSGD